MRNRYVNRYHEPREDGLATFIHFLVIFALIAGAVQVCIMLYRHDFTTGQLDCSECHSRDIHETKKNIQYLQEKKYKDPKRWLK